MSSVLEVPEILEIVLSNLDPLTLLFASLPFIFRSSRHSRDELWPDRKGPHRPEDFELNPLLVSAFPLFFPTTNLDSSDPSIFCSISDGTYMETTRHLLRENFRLLPWNQSRKKTDAFRWAQASWRKMLLTRSASFYLIVGGISTNSSKFSKEISLDHDMKMGFLWDLVFELLIDKKYHGHSLIIQWPKTRFSLKQQHFRDRKSLETAREIWLQDKTVNVLAIVGSSSSLCSDNLLQLRSEAATGSLAACLNLI
ncbi:hypothetical protein BGHDH14_bghG001381000001001 [Blumeria hordei DH14]|uniref:Uncharacterized protein n=1 Tax=Blumeria graminis f. sp. hordei (strain DH14) TaxID=546991 RepID=N1J6V5_BLUG1|nr:hypothetical protein BGHDH14_bghG001381000001001 [Blumeria hordei DH14]